MSDELITELHYNVTSRFSTIVLDIITYYINPLVQNGLLYIGMIDIDTHATDIVNEHVIRTFELHKRKIHTRLGNTYANVYSYLGSDIFYVTTVYRTTAYENNEIDFSIITKMRDSDTIAWSYKIRCTAKLPLVWMIGEQIYYMQSQTRLLGALPSYYDTIIKYHPPEYNIEIMWSNTINAVILRHDKKYLVHLSGHHFYRFDLISGDECDIPCRLDSNIADWSGSQFYSGQYIYLVASGALHLHKINHDNGLSQLIYIQLANHELLFRNNVKQIVHVDDAGAIYFVVHELGVLKISADGNYISHVRLPNCTCLAHKSAAGSMLIQCGLSTYYNITYK